MHLVIAKASQRKCQGPQGNESLSRIVSTGSSISLTGENEAVNASISVQPGFQSGRLRSSRQTLDPDRLETRFNRERERGMYSLTLTSLVQPKSPNTSPLIWALWFELPCIAFSARRRAFFQRKKKNNFVMDVLTSLPDDCLIKIFKHFNRWVHWIRATQFKQNYLIAEIHWKK